VQPIALRQTHLPAVAFELGTEMFFLREAHAEIGNMIPPRGHLQRAEDFLWVKDRNPSGANNLRPRREPKSMDGGDNRIIERASPASPCGQGRSPLPAASSQKTARWTGASPQPATAIWVGERDCRQDFQEAG
jgi:hypothetical protein